MKTLAIVLSLCLASPSLTCLAQTAPAPIVQASSAQKKPIPQPLTEDETKRLKQRDEQPGKEVAGGALTNQQITYILIALGTAVIVLIAVR